MENEVDPEARKKEKELLAKWKAKQEAAKTDAQIEVLKQQNALMQQNAGRGRGRLQDTEKTDWGQQKGGRQQDRGKPKGGKGRREVEEEEEDGEYPPIALVTGETIHPSLKGFMAPDLDEIRLGFKDCHKLDVKPRRGFRYRCGICLKMGHHYNVMTCGAKELSLPQVVKRDGERMQIINYRGMFDRGIIDAEGCPVAT